MGSTHLAEGLAHWRRVVRLLEGLPESADTVPLALEARAAVLSFGWIVGITADEAAKLFTESRALAARAGDPSALAIFTAHYAGIKAAHREIDEYVRLSWEAVRIAERTGDAALRAAMWPPLVRSHLLSGRLREALTLSEQALSALPEDPAFGTLLGYSPYLNLMQLRANLLAYAGRWPEATGGFERMIAAARAHRSQGLVASASSDYGWWAALFGDAPTALAQGRRGLEIAEKLGNRLTQVYACNALGVAELTGEEAALQTLAHLAEAYLAEGDAARARELAENAVSEACRHRVLAAECFARLVQARVLLSSEGLAGGAGAASALERALALVEETGARCYAAFVRVERARLARLSGDEAGYEHEMRLAQRLFTEMGATARAEEVARKVGR